MQQALLALQQRCRTFEAAAGDQQALIGQLRAQHAREMQACAVQIETERKGWKETLDFTSDKYAELQAQYEQASAECLRLQRVLDASDGQPTMAVPALADEPDSFTAVPDPAPVPDFRISDIPPGPVGEAADVNARTQQTDVRSLRHVAAVLDQGPVRTTWGVSGLSTRPPLPDETPTERFDAVTAVLSLAEHFLPVQPAAVARAVEASPISGSRAREKVHAALTP